MNIKNSIEVLRDELNTMTLDDTNLTKDKIVRLSEELDKLIEKYYLCEDKTDYFS